jgi:hypothetical protein
MKNTQLFTIIFLLIVFVIGLFATMYFKPPITNEKNDIENMESPQQPGCPDMLVKKGQSLALYNTKQPVSEGSNPILFQSLDDYIDFVGIQEKNGINCPILYLQEEVNTQGENVYRMRPSPFDLQGGLPTTTPEVVEISDASRKNYPYNENNYPGFDPEGQYVGIYTNLDAIHDSTKQSSNSDNPMDPNWGGIEYTRDAVKSGKYEDREITKPVFGRTVNTSFIPGLPSNRETPIDIL